MRVGRDQISWVPADPHLSLPPLPISDKEVRSLFGFCHPGFLILSQTDLHPEKDPVLV